MGRQPPAPHRAPGGPAAAAQGAPGFVSLSRGAGGVAAEHPPPASCSRGRVRRGRPRLRAARAGSAVTGRASRRRAGTPPAPSLHYRTALTSRSGHGLTRPSKDSAAAAQPRPLHRLAAPFLSGVTAARRALGGARGPRRRTLPQATEPRPAPVTQVGKWPCL